MDNFKKALLAGASLAVSGLLLQTLFRNPLAGPSILGISDGANLGVAAIMLYFGGSLSMVTDLPISKPTSKKNSMMRSMKSLLMKT